MSPKRWILLLIFYISYLMFGASIYYHIEHGEERAERAESLKARIDINEYLLEQLANKSIDTQNEILQRITDYCGKPVTDYNADENDVPYTWTFYHAIFFSFTVCSTVGYGNISPTTVLGRWIMIFYSLIGIPINGILFAGLGEYFSKTFEAIYRRYKQYKMTQDKYYVPPKLSLITTILIALVPGISIFILLPSWVFSYFESWPYETALYYCYVTMSTIGFGDYVPTFQADQPREFGGWFIVYEIFVIVWFIFALGYLVMIMTFITRGLQSQRLASIEQHFASNFKSTQQRIWNGVTKDVGNLRKILNELYLSKIKPVYNETEESKLLHRSTSAPELSMFRKEPAPLVGRKRAYSEAPYLALSGLDGRPLLQASSDTELYKIDKNRSFATADDFRQTTDLLAKVVSALATVKAPAADEMLPGMEDIFGGYHGFPDAQILHGEIPKGRGRARSDFNLYPTWHEPRQAFEHNEWTWSGDNDQIQEAINNRHKRSHNPYEEHDNFAITIEDRENMKPRIKKFSMPDGLRKLFGSRKNSSRELFPNANNKNVNERKFSVVSVPETQLQGGDIQANSYYNTVTSGECMKTSDQDINVPTPAISGMYQKYLTTAVLGSSGNISKKRRESLFAQNPALSSRRSSMLTSNSGAQGYLGERYPNKALTPRKGSLYPLPSQSRRPSIFSVTSDEDRDVLENTTLADLIRALEAVHTKTVLDEEEKDALKNRSLTELGGIFGLDDRKLRKASRKDNPKKEQLSKRRSTIVGMQTTLANSATATPLRRRRVGEVQNPQKDLNVDLSTNTLQVPAHINAPSQKLQRRFSVRPTALQIVPGKAPPVLKDLSPPRTPTPLAIASSVQQRRALQRPSPLAQERRDLSSSDNSPVNSAADISTSRLLPMRPATSSSTFSPLSRIVQIAQAAQIKNSVPDSATASKAKDNEAFSP